MSRGSPNICKDCHVQPGAWLLAGNFICDELFRSSTALHASPGRSQAAALRSFEFEQVSWPESKIDLLGFWCSAGTGKCLILVTRWRMGMGYLFTDPRVLSIRIKPKTAFSLLV